MRPGSITKTTSSTVTEVSAITVLTMTLRRVGVKVGVGVEVRVGVGVGVGVRVGVHLVRAEHAQQVDAAARLVRLLAAQGGGVVLLRGRGWA